MRSRALALSLIAALGAACAPSLPTAPTEPREDEVFEKADAPTLPGLSDEAPAAFTFLPGDVVSLRVVSLETVETPGLIVDETGSLDVPLVGPIEVGGLTVARAQSRVEDAVHTLDHVARVVMIVTDAAGHRATVTGAVERPGVVPVRAGTRVAELISLGGGPKVREHEGRSLDLSDLPSGRVVRDGVALPVSLERALKGDPRHNVRVRAGDILWVPAAQAREITVLGDVQAPKAVPFHDGMRLSKALAMAGGPTRQADEADVRIVRGPLSAPRVYRASLKALVSGDGKDVALRPGDVVYVTEHWFAKTTEVIQRLTPLIVGAAVTANATK